MHLFWVTNNNRIWACFSSASFASHFHKTKLFLLLLLLLLWSPIFNVAFFAFRPFSCFRRRCFGNRFHFVCLMNDEQKTCNAIICKGKRDSYWMNKNWIFCSHCGTNEGKIQQPDSHSVRCDIVDAYFGWNKTPSVAFYIHSITDIKYTMQPHWANTNLYRYCLHCSSLLSLLFLLRLTFAAVVLVLFLLHQFFFSFAFHVVVIGFVL